LCQAIHRILATDQVSDQWSRRAGSQFESIRAGFAWLQEHAASVVVLTEGKLSWWTFAGGRANAALATELEGLLAGRVSGDILEVRLEAGGALEPVAGLIEQLRGIDPRQIVPAVSEESLDGLKFAECLPKDLAIRTVQGRLLDVEGVAEVLRGAIRVVSES
jgi:ATP-dependent Lhr-like helicase